MGTYTPRKKLYKPTLGETGYDDKFERTMDCIDADGCFKDLNEIITGRWEFRAPIEIDPTAASPPLILGTYARGQMVAGLNAEEVGGKKAELLENLHLFFAGNQVSSSTYYYMGAERSTIESHRQFLMPKCEVFALYIDVSSNTLNGGCEVTVRQNGGASALSLTIAAGSIGSFSDMDVVSFATGDRLSLRIHTAGTAGSITLVVRIDYRLVA